MQRSGVGTGGGAGGHLNQPTLPELNRCFNQPIDKDNFLKHKFVSRNKEPLFVDASYSCFTVTCFNNSAV